MLNALIDNDTGAVLEWGAVAYVPSAGQSVRAITDASTLPEGEPNRYLKVVGGVFVAMDAIERAAVNRRIPQRRAQRIAHAGEVRVWTHETDPGGGWGDVIALTTAEPVLAGFYQLVCGLELGLTANSNMHVAQAQLEVDGVEVATWANNRSAYTRVQFVDTFALATGDRPTFRLRLRRLGGVPGTARARKASIVLYPADAIGAELV